MFGWGKKDQKAQGKAEEKVEEKVEEKTNGMADERIVTNKMELEKRIIETLKQIFDPEIPVNIFDLGLIYEVNVAADFSVQIVMTLTAPNCPVADSLPNEVNEKIKALEGVKEVHVELTFEPSWDKDMMSEEAQLDLGLL